MDKKFMSKELSKIFSITEKKLRNTSSDLEIWDILTSMDKKLNNFRNKYYSKLSVIERLDVDTLIRREVARLERIAKRKLRNVHTILEW